MRHRKVNEKSDCAHDALGDRITAIYVMMAIMRVKEPDAAYNESGRGT